MRSLVTMVVLSVLSGCASGRPSKAEASGHPMARKPTPAIELQLASGAAFHPVDSRGKVLVLDFWATWCAPCRASFPKIDAIFKKHASAGLEVIANEDEDRSKVQPFLDEVKPSFTVAYDKGGKGAEAFGVETMPSSFVIDRRGIVRYAHSGYHPDDALTIESEIEELLAEAP